MSGMYFLNLDPYVLAYRDLYMPISLMSLFKTDIKMRESQFLICFMSCFYMMFEEHIFVL